MNDPYDPELLYLDRLATRAEAAREALAERGIAVSVSVEKTGGAVVGLNVDRGIEGEILALEAMVYYIDQMAFEEDMESDIFGDSDFSIEDLLGDDDE